LAELREVNWDSDGSVYLRIEEKKSRSPSSNQKVVLGGLRGSVGDGFGRLNNRESERSA